MLLSKIQISGSRKPSGLTNSGEVAPSRLAEVAVQWVDCDPQPVSHAALQSHVVLRRPCV